MEKVRDTEALDLYNTAQVFLIKLMLLEGTIKDAGDYAEKYAAVFSMLASGDLQSSSEPDWDDIRKQVRSAVFDNEE